MPRPPKTVPYTPFMPDRAPDAAARSFYETMRQRRSVREFSARAVPREVIEWCVGAAGTSPSGANKQPWRFVCISDQDLKRQIRLGAEAEEREFYAHRATPEWLADLAPLGTDDDKAFLELAPWLIVVLKLVKGDPDHAGHQGRTYYTNESVGIATGFLLAALHHAGLATLTHTPSPMGFLGMILDRPEHERPFLLIPVGYANEECEVPDISRKPLDEIMIVREQTPSA